MNSTTPKHHPSIGTLNRKGAVGANILIGGASPMWYARCLPYDMMVSGIDACLAERRNRVRKAGVTQAILRNPGGTDGQMSLAQLVVMERGLASLNPIVSYRRSMGAWWRDLGWLPAIYVGKVEEYGVLDAQVEACGWTASLDAIVTAFVGQEIIIDHSSRYASGSPTYQAIEALATLDMPVSVEPRCPRGSETQNDVRLATYTQSPVFRKSLKEGWATPLDECQNRVHAVFVEDPVGQETSIGEIRQWLEWGLDVYVPLDEQGRYLGVRGEDLGK